MQGPFCPGRAFCGLSAGSVFSKRRLEYQAWPQAAPTACAGPARACFWHTAQSARIFPFPPARKPTAIVSAQGARSGNLPLAASPARCRGESFLQATTGRAVAARALCPFPKKRYPGKAGKTANRAEYREKLRQAKIITPGRAGMQNAARPKRGARHFLPVFCSKHAPQAPVLGLPLSPLLPGEGGVLPSSYS